MMKKTVVPLLFYDILRGLKALCDSCHSIDAIAALLYGYFLIKWDFDSDFM